jgi:hypothetical protein
MAQFALPDDLPFFRLTVYDVEDRLVPESQFPDCKLRIPITRF